MKVKTAKLTGAALNWVVASIEWPNDSGILNPELMSKESVEEDYPFNKDWSLTGPIIAREGIWIQKYTDNLFVARGRNDQYYDQGVDGSAYLQSALRCYIANKLGDEAEVPDNLL